jgi:hypothetical protein
MGAMKTLLSALLLGSAGVAAAATSNFRCGSELITKGNRQSEVLAYCGPPSDVVRTSTWRTPAYWHFGRRYYYGDGLVEMPVELWTYNLGPSNLMRELRFEGGALVSVRSLGYGYHPVAPRY